MRWIAAWRSKTGLMGCKWQLVDLAMLRVVLMEAFNVSCSARKLLVHEQRLQEERVCVKSRANSIFLVGACDCIPRLPCFPMTSLPFSLSRSS